MSDLKPADLVSEVSQIVWMTDGWISPQEIWNQIQQLYPHVARRVTAQVQTYADPRRNNEVWFVSNTLHHMGETEAFELSNVDEYPDNGTQGQWLIIRTAIR